MQNDNIDMQRQRLTEAAVVAGFEASDIGRLYIQWLNAEIYRLTESLVNDASLDLDNVKRAAVRGELTAYRTIANKLNLTKVKAIQAKRTLEANGVTVEDALDPRSPEELASATP